MKTTIIEYQCDMCHRRSTDSLDFERVRIPVLGMVDCEGKPFKEPFVFIQEMDLCRECAKRATTITETARNKFEFLEKFGNQQMEK